MNRFEIRTVQGKGRAMFATKAIAAGDVIFEEEPFVSCQFSWNAAYGYAACDHCMRPLETVQENVHRLAKNNSIVVPLPEHDPTAQWLPQFSSCPNCKVKYCSEDCRQESLRRYHRAACMGAFHNDDTHPINQLNETWKKIHYPPETGSIMLIVRLMAMYAQSSNKQDFVDQLQSFQSLIVNFDQKICHKMLGDEFEEQMKQLYLAFCKAFADAEFDLFTEPPAFQALMAILGTNSQGVATSPLAEWVKKVTNLSLPDADKAKIDEVIDFIYNKIDDEVGDFLNTEGSGLYLLQSKINHSCVPNAKSTFPYSNDIVVLEAITPIEVGEEICISYIDACQLSRSRHSRQKILKENYIFVCDCARCRSQANDPEETSDEEMDDGDEYEEADDEVMA